MPNAFLSVVIRNRNEASNLRACLAALRQQSVQDFELVLVDNESDDDSREVAREAAAMIVTINRKEFTYGKAINRGIAASGGDIILLLSPHSIPLHSDFLSIIRTAFSDPVVAGVRCVQATRLKEVPEWHVPVVLRKGADVDVILQWGLNATCCAIRRQVWEMVPFEEEIEAAEDKVWTSRVLERGYEIHRVPALYGYIKQADPKMAATRKFREALAVYRAFGLRPRYTILGPISAMTIGGFRRYWRDVSSSWRSYLLMRKIEKVAKSKPAVGSLW